MNDSSAAWHESPPVFLNHFYMVLDSATYKAIEQDEFLREQFAVNEHRTTVREDQTYTGLYFYGTNTYFEFFDVANSPRPEIGDSGVAFGVDRPGAVEDLKKACGPEFATGIKVISRAFQEQQVPWFYMATPRSLPYESGLSSWVMEYHPDFLRKWHPNPNRSNMGIRRRDILKRYSEVLEPVNEPALEDVISLTVAADQATADRFSHFCVQLGFSEKAEGGTVALHGTDFLLHLLPVTEHAHGVREVKMRLRNLPLSETERRIGDSILKLSGGIAIWSFHGSFAKL